MKVLFISIAWPSTGERNLYSDLMDEFVSNGHDVYVAATRNPGQKEYEELTEENGINVLRVQAGKIRKASHVRKAFSLLSLGSILYRGIRKHFKGLHFDLIVSPTPPVTLSILHRKLKKQHRAFFYLLLKDIWPQSSLDLGIFRLYSLPWIFMRWHEKQSYKTADYIGAMSPMNVEYLLEKNSFLSAAGVEECPNSLRPSLGLKSDRHMLIREKFGIPADSCVFLFSGNLGIGHGLDFLVDVIKKLSDYPKAFFVVGGSGTHFKILEESLGASRSSNVFLYSWLPRDEFDLVLETSDVGLILLNKQYTTPEFPSRLLSYLDSGIPVLCAINRGTDIGTIVEESRCGSSLFHGDTEAFVREVKFYSENKQERLKMGENARKLLLDRYTTERGYEIINAHLGSNETNH